MKGFVFFLLILAAVTAPVYYFLFMCNEPIIKGLHVGMDLEKAKKIAIDLLNEYEEDPAIDNAEKFSMFKISSLMLQYDENKKIVSIFIANDVSDMIFDAENLSDDEFREKFMKEHKIPDMKQTTRKNLLTDMDTIVWEYKYRDLYELSISGKNVQLCKAGVQDALEAKFKSIIETSLQDAIDSNEINYEDDSSADEEYESDIELEESYVDDEKGFTISYPADWTGSKYRSGSVVANIKSKDKKSGLDVRVQEWTGSIFAFADQMTKIYTEQLGADRITKKFKTIGNCNGCVLSSKSNRRGNLLLLKCYILKPSSSNQIYMFQAGANFDERDIFEPILDSIANSFRLR
ncbi:MAG: hypothetical protein CVV64_20265 [Candidatus Wallbacteria bacterium HGW-Wallbacteria-1]|jgi:hypothetical protein|uniref:Uncharacterized protein n=1 Tax=Candidatus Wallbacteria bacterium HGW-Wallbacteria-1 TaxID=2013854 RepID=A0A2N1PIC6_9BACT|nr:MAG: hypothetical protein CVV64_20265 [Candidatus Wallbacteria bacterium HGW-Wallbacteria-1]